MKPWICRSNGRSAETPIRRTGHHSVLREGVPRSASLEVLKSSAGTTTNASWVDCPKVVRPRRQRIASTATTRRCTRWSIGSKRVSRRVPDRELNLRPDGSLPCTVVETEPVAPEAKLRADHSPPRLDAARGRKAASPQLAAQCGRSSHESRRAAQTASRRAETSVCVRSCR